MVVDVRSDPKASVGTPTQCATFGHGGWSNVLTHNRRNIPLADIGLIVIGDTEIVADHVRSLGYRVNDQMSIFSAISIASSTSMPR